MTLQQQVETLVASTTGQNEFTPNGVPKSYDWCSTGRMGLGSDPGSFTAAVPWGTIYLAAGATADPTAVVQISHMKIATLSLSTGQWTVREVSITGGYFVENLVGNVATKLVDLNTDPATITSSIPAGTTLHFFSSGRIPINPSDFGGAIVSYDARVISASGTINATYIANSGLDYWRDMAAGYEGPGVANLDAFVGSFHPLNSGGGTIYGTTLTVPELLAATPPSNMLPDATEPQTIYGGIGNDYLDGDMNDNAIYGNDVIVGREGEDTLYGGNGNDWLNGDFGHDDLIRGLGKDTPLISVDVDGVQFALVGGNRADYSVTGPSASAKVVAGASVSISGGSLDAPANFNNLAKISFADSAYNLEIRDKAASVSPHVLNSIVDLYVAYFNRVPEASGLSFWIDHYVAGKSLFIMAAEFYAAGIQYSNVTGYTADMPLSDFIKVLYANMLGRSGSSAPPQEDIDYWLDQVATGSVTREGMVARFLNDARLFYDDTNVGWVPQLLDQKVEFGKLHAVTYGLDYNDSQTSIQTTVALAAAVTPTGYADAVAMVGLSADDYLAV